MLTKKLFVGTTTHEFNKKRGTGEVNRILILSANPKATSRVRFDEEIREIEDGILRARHRDQFDLKARLAVRYKDLRRTFLEYKPQIVHFIGHGDKEGLMIEDEIGNARSISIQALSGLFELCSNHVESVILNACYSAPQANAISEHIDYVIGMSEKIMDDAAIEFAVGFYDALIARESIERAFAFGCNAIRVLYPDFPAHLIPVLKKGRELKETGDQQDAQPPEDEPQEKDAKELLEEGLRSLEIQDYDLAFEKFQKARALMPENEKAQFLYCLSFLIGTPIRDIEKPDMNKITQTLKNIVRGGDRETSNLARIVLGIIWYDYYLKEDHRYQELFFKENKRFLENYRPSSEEQQLINHIAPSDNAKTLFKLD